MKIGKGEYVWSIQLNHLVIFIKLLDNNLKADPIFEILKQINVLKH